MKNKISMLFLPFLAFSLAACEKAPEGPAEPSGEGGGTPAVTYEVTEAEFDDAVDFKMKNLTYTGKTFEGDEVKDDLEIYLLEDGSTYQKQCFGWGEHIFQHMPDDTYRQLRKNETGQWFAVSYRTKEGYLNGNFGDDFGMDAMIRMMAGNYSHFTYDATQQTYSGTVTFEEMGDMEFVVALKFENKHLLKFDMSLTYMGMTGGYSAEMKDYGTTVIDYESLNIRDDLYVAGRTFKIAEVIDEGMFDHNPEVLAQFINGNANSTLIFNEDGTFLMSYDLDFSFSGPKDYSGTYTFEKVEDVELSFNITSGLSEPMEVYAGFHVSDGEEGGCYFTINMEVGEGRAFQITFEA